MADAVITWVNGDDPKHQEKLKRYLPSEPGGGIKARYIHPTRFKGLFELWFCVKLIRKNAPWIDTIHLVTDNQRPKWLTDKEAEALNIALVDHSVIFSGFEDYLPTFNSRTIETALHRIPGLSNEFLYFNDDVFLVRPTEEKDYFDGSLPIWRCVRESRIKRIKKLRKTMKNMARKWGISWYRDGLVSTGEETKNVLGPGKLFQLAHAPHPFNRSHMAAIVEKNALIEANLGHRFRNREQIKPLPLIANEGIRRARGMAGPRDWYYIDFDHHDNKTIEKRIKKCLATPSIRSSCVQSLDVADQAGRDMIKNFLQTILEK